MIWDCVIYLVLISIASFFTGRILPKRWFRWDMFPYRSYGFEKNGRIYLKIGIHKWQNRILDISKILPFMIPKKELSEDSIERLPRMIQETCVAELIHGMNAVLGLYCLKICPGAGGIAFAVIYAIIFNLPFILVQRYNRPRLVELNKRLEKKRSEIKNENVDSEL